MQGVHPRKVPLWVHTLLCLAACPIPAGGTPEVSSVYDYNTGTYVKAPMRVAPFCSGKRHVPSARRLVLQLC